MTRRRLSVLADAISVDLVLSAAVPVESLIPPIVDALAEAGGVEPGVAAVSYQLSRLDGGVLDPSKTLADHAIRDGCTLVLVRSAMRFVPPPYDDEAEAVSATIGEVARTWTRHSTRLVGALVSGCLASVAAVVLIRGAFGADAHRIGCAGVALGAGLLALLAAVFAFRVADEADAGLTLGLMAVGFVALAGMLAVPGGPGVPNALLCTAAAATAAAALRVFARQATVFTALMCLATSCAAAAAVGALVAAPPPAIGAGLAATSLAVVEGAAPLSMMLARLSPVADSPDHLHAKAIQAHTWLNSVIAAFSASAAVGAISATQKPDLPGIVFETVVGLALVLRARAHQDVGRSLPPIICGAVTLCAALIAAAVAYPRHALEIAALSTTLSTLALYIGFMAGSTPSFPAGRRSVELAQYFALAMVAPLAFWLCGLYGAARSLNMP